MMTGGDPTPLVPEVYTRDIVAEVPVLARIAEIETRILFALDSSDMQPHHWVEIAQAVHAGLCARDDAGALRYQGVVVVHGTDTMAYTASAVAFLLRGVDRPVVFTGAQRPLSEVRTDGSVMAHGIPDDIPRRQGERIARIATDAALRQFTRTRKVRPCPSRDDKRLFTKVAKEAIRDQATRTTEPTRTAA